MKQLAEFIKNGSRFAVISHVSPDGDTLGSAAALISLIKKSGKQAKWFCEGSVPEDFMKIPEIAALVRENTDLDGFDSVIAADVSDIERMGNCRALFERTPRKAQIDHHATNTRFADVNVVDTRSANAFLVLALADEMGIPLDREIARALFVGISTDTGRLSHAGVTARDVADTARLYEFDIRQDEIISILFQTASLKKTHIRGRASEHVEQAFDGKVTYTYLDTEDYLEFDADSADSDGAVESCRSVEGTLIAFFIRQIPEGYKLSMRSKPDYDVSAICAEFGGGGHKLAAGATLSGTREQVISAVLEKIGEIL